ncbi:hypothetical protein [Streptomyces formicae]|uniref:Uncharacterized protein n=1 Tax=Streptomyces formicae TaxID=1616117 RepID=A0ABY3WIC2_9ACTN|nr:hypothetical protein [Streptomyces formicae]UNM12333.1 hypothetical protein J4032_13010 [Streptomyces formicae]
MGFWDNVLDASIGVPIIGGWIEVLRDDDRPETATSRAISSVLEPASMPIEKAMHGINWVYDNGISQPISTFLLMGAQNENLSDVGGFFSGSNWSRTWHAANHISPGQAIGVMGTTENEGARAVIDSPLQYAAPALSDLPADWGEMSEDEQQALLKGAGMPAVGNREVEKLRRENEGFSFVSGAADLAFRWWLDPVVLGGRAAGAVREATIVKPRPKGGWSSQDIDKIMADSTMGKAQDFLWANRNDPALINNLTMFKRSALGPRAGGIISTLRSPEEVNLFLRTSLGDARARLTLQERNAVAAQRLEQDTARLAELDLALPRVIAQNNPRAQAMVEQRIEDLNRQVNADETLAARYGEVLKHYGELDAVNLTRWSFSRAERRTAAQARYRTGPALGTAGSARTPVATARIYANDFFGPNLVVVRSFAESHPNGLIAVDDIHPEAIDELRGHIARIPGIGPGARAGLLDGYLKTTTEGERLVQLEKIQKLGVQKVAEKRGFTADEAMELYREHMGNLVGGQDKLRRYSAGAFPGEAVHLDEFMDGGGKLSVHPNMVTRLINDQVMIDLKALDTTLARHGSALKALRTASLGNKDWLVNSLDYFNHLWKFATLFRLGYIPRVLGDDIAGQTARLGAATMAARTGFGVKNLATNLAHWRPASHYEAQEAAAREGLKYIDEEIKLLKPQANVLRAKVKVRQSLHEDSLRRARDRHRRATNRLNALGPEATPTQIGAHQKLVEKHAGEVQRAEQRVATRLIRQRSKLSEMDEQLAELTAQRAASLDVADGLKLAKDRGFRQKSQLYKGVEIAPGTVLPAAFAGERGEYYMKMISSDDSLRTLLQRNKQVVHSNLQRAYGNQGVAISYPQDPAKFVSSWHQAVNQQIMQDPFAVQAVKGATAEEMARWLTRTPAGRAYRKRLGIKYSPAERLAASVWHEVADYLPTAEIRMAALEGKADIDFLKAAAEMGHHPFNVHTTQLGESLAGSNHASKGLDRVVDWWYKWAASQPADRMSRHPLFNQLYEGHAKQLAKQRFESGTKITQAEADEIAEGARRLALKDTRRLVFDIAHRSDTAHMLRFMSPFFAATTEAWQRWARIIADRPQTVGYASMFFNAPISAGWMQDMDGNRIQRDGTVMTTDPKTGKAVKRFVPKGERYIMARVPKFVADGPVGKAFGMDSSKRWMVSQDSMNLITQGDPFFNPGTGPIVSIPVNEFVKDKPSQGELARKLGVLPFGPTAGSPLFGNTPVGRAADLSMPQTVKNFLTAYDTTDERYQRVKLHIMQRAAYEHAELGKPMPSPREIADMTKQYWLESAVWAFSQPAATQRPDKYQFYRDQYNNLRRQDPRSADEKFLERFGESYFIFAQATSENKVGAEATKAAVELSKKYENQLAANPELGALIIGPEGSGPFSPEAYTYQLTHPLVPGGSEMQRMKLDAEEAMKENQRRLGWAKFVQMQNAVTAELQNAGFSSFSDPGAEQLKAKRGAIARLYGEPLLPDGTENPYYNEEWSKDFNTFDPKKYDRLIPGLTEVANSEMAKNPNRTDLRMLQTYLQGRKELLAELAARKAAGGAGTLKAKANVDLAGTWARFVDDLRERDTRFGDLHSRYLSRDLGVDVEELADQLEAEEEEEVF